MARHGLLAEFDSPDAVLAAAHRLRAEGCRRLEAYSPFPVEGLAAAIGFDEPRLPWIALAGGLAGAIGGYLMQWGTNAVDYPLNIGGRPLDAWQAFAVISFYLMSLGTIVAVIAGMLILSGLPRLHHPIFDAKRFDRVTDDRFFLAIEPDDAGFDPAATRALLERQGALAIEELPG